MLLFCSAQPHRPITSDSKDSSCFRMDTKRSIALVTEDFGMPKVAASSLTLSGLAHTQIALAIADR